MIRKAILKDIDHIMDILNKTKSEMHIYNNFQWDENYPTKEDFIDDIKKENLYCMAIENSIAGFVCANTTQPIEYNVLNWSSTNAAMVIHRMSVNPKFRQKGIGTELIKFVETIAIKDKIEYLKTDTYSLNVKMNNLFKKCGFHLIGEMSFLGKEKPFYCYDKIIK